MIAQEAVETLKRESTTLRRGYIVESALAPNDVQAVADGVLAGEVDVDGRLLIGLASTRLIEEVVRWAVVAKALESEAVLVRLLAEIPFDPSGVKTVIRAFAAAHASVFEESPHLRLLVGAETLRIVDARIARGLEEEDAEAFQRTRHVLEKFTLFRLAQEVKP